MPIAKVLFVHTGKKHTQDIEKLLKNESWQLSSTAAKDLPLVFPACSPDCVVLAVDKNIQEATQNILEDIKAFDDNLPVIIVAQSKSLEDAVEVMKKGSFDYFSAPIDVERFKLSVAHAIRLYSLTKRVFILENQAGLRGSFDEMIGQCSKMQEIFNMTQMVAKSNATVLIMGESGTGKELVARAVHRCSDRSKKTFLDINCGAIPHELLENEMFGHERGAYTGADKRYIGSVERAHEGTLFLDEISEMDASLQVKLLRFLQERTFTRIGGTQTISVDVRIVAATNKNLSKAVEAGLFREDLYYRLNVVPIQLPTLWERQEDIALLAQHFLEKYSAKNEKIFIDISLDTIEALMSYSWPGNVRELENVIERAVVLNNDNQLRLKHLPEQVRNSKKQDKASIGTEIPLHDGGRILPLELVEKYAIEAALKRCLGNVSEAAGKLKIGQATLYRKIKQFGLRV